MHELDARTGEEFVHRPAERPLPRRIELREVAVESRDGQHIQRDGKEAIAFFLDTVPVRGLVTQRLIGEHEVRRPFLHEALEVAEQDPQLRVRLQQFLRTEIERALDHAAVAVCFEVGLIHGRDERFPLRRHVRRTKELGQLAPQQRVLDRHGCSEIVVIVMVWLCSSHDAFGVNGEISP